MKHLYAGLLLAGSAIAQDVDYSPEPAMDHLAFFQAAVPPPGGGVAMGGIAGAAPRTIQFVSGQLVGGNIKGSPYSAESVVETVQTLSDGNRIVNRNTTKQFRDSEGRERREMTMGNEKNAPQMIMISDPVAGLSLTLHPEEKVAQKNPMMGQTFSTMSRDVAFMNSQVQELDPKSAKLRAETVHLEAGTTESMPTFAAAGMPGMMIANRTAVWATSEMQDNAKEESLGARVIEGVSATGTRRTTTIPAGQIGNERAIETVVETWYSPDLKMTVLSETTDPRMGKTTMKLTNINRSEPARTLFEVPPGYTVTEGPTPFTLAKPAQRIALPAGVQK